jgi:hypothetical protein
MSAVVFENGEFSVDAAEIAKGLRMLPTQVLTGMRHRRITSLCERGIDEDAGRYRLTFFYRRRQFCLVVDEAGNILERRIETHRHKRS